MDLKLQLLFQLSFFSIFRNIPKFFFLFPEIHQAALLSVLNRCKRMKSVSRDFRGILRKNNKKFQS